MKLNKEKVKDNLSALFSVEKHDVALQIIGFLFICAYDTKEMQEGLEEWLYGKKQKNNLR